MHRAFVGDFRRSLALLSGERAFKLDSALDVVAGNAIDIYLFMAERNADIGQGEPFAFGDQLRLADGDCLLVSSLSILCNDNA